MDRLKKVVLIIIALIWIGAIFTFSMDRDSNMKSMKVAEEVVEASSMKVATALPIDKWDNKDAVKTTITRVKEMNYFIRKAGHFIEYGVLGAILYVLLYRKGKKIFDYLPSILFFGLFIAVMDEYIQSYFNRTSLVSDILIDFSGIVISLLLLVVCNKSVLLIRKVLSNA